MKFIFLLDPDYQKTTPIPLEWASVKTENHERMYELLSTKNIAFIEFGSSVGDVQKVFDYKVFPGVEETVKKIISRVGIQSTYGPLLKIGSAFIMDMGVSRYFIYAPIKITSNQPINEQNVYWAFRGILEILTRRMDIEYVILPIVNDSMFTIFDKARKDFISSKWIHLN